mmetsp:Transcript_26013/g.84686  ORF Transcript_26013/g.84686 Transcript_26013/m.84686 type:complete len:297 (-) Transcript_26013:16-906(-)
MLTAAEAMSGSRLAEKANGRCSQQPTQGGRERGGGDGRRATPTAQARSSGISRQRKSARLVSSSTNLSHSAASAATSASSSARGPVKPAPRMEERPMAREGALVSSVQGARLRSPPGWCASWRRDQHAWLRAGGAARTRSSSEDGVAAQWTIERRSLTPPRRGMWCASSAPALGSSPAPRRTHSPPPSGASKRSGSATRRAAARSSSEKSAELRSADRSTSRCPPLEHSRSSASCSRRSRSAHAPADRVAAAAEAFAAPFAAAFSSPFRCLSSAAAGSTYIGAWCWMVWIEKGLSR